ncbi:MerR family transcriptional regulator [Nicoliella spurrieriana]|uniref:MerR family transcriptional regulator n=1 Tax=Nicoliella spurrieriana TaxID=2925830 RepID=A0A976X5J9_9LACO|nr:MerR family transcriptional regulator [Nicoliella spurrieriana]UQS86672.1 MerR family transcriptional regulator [Nicoliella spurrieriana]
MSEKELRRSLSVLPIGTVMKLTDLTARQIRYYEEQGLVSPERNEGNRRMYSLNDIDRILEVKDFLSEGLNIADIQAVLAKREAKRKQEQATLAKSISDDEARRLLQDEFLHLGGLSDNDNPFNNPI